MMGTLYSQVFVLLMLLVHSRDASSTGSISSDVGSPEIKSIEEERRALLRIKEHLHNVNDGDDQHFSLRGAAGEPKMRCVEAERQALLNIKHLIKGVSNNTDPLSSWGDEEKKRDCCKWLGIRCSNKSSNVISLDLSPSTFGGNYLTLTGTISPSLFELRYLTYLDLSHIDFSGSHFPSSICSLSQLRYLNLSFTFLMGEIPPQIANLSSLEVLDLGSTDNLVTTKVLECASHLSSLRILNLKGTDLSRVTDWVQRVNQLSSLTELNLALSRLPYISNLSSLSSVNSSTSLASLDLWGNDLSTSIYPWLWNFSNSLVYLDLSSNQLEGSIPEALSKMTTLTYLDLRGNKLEGSITEAFGKMIGLTCLGLGDNYLSGSIPEIFENMSALEILDLGDNMLQGQILTSIWNQSKLRVLVMGPNNLSGHLPQTPFQRLKQLEMLDISGNSLGGVISEAAFSHLSKLHYLDLSFNSFTLDINSDWVPPFQLQYIFLRSCKLGPQFPKWLQTQKSYKFLDISNNEISDTIPTWLWYLSTVEEKILNLSNNKIKEKIGDMSLEFQANLWTSIDLSSNYLEGPVPSFLFRATATQLNLQQNRFSNLNFLCNVTGDQPLNYLDVSYNKLSGELPDCWSPYKELKYLNLRENNLSGKIPSSIGSLIVIEQLLLANNKFIGEIPSTLRNCTHLSIIDFGENKLSGPIPTWMGENLTSLVILILRSNYFNGSIPLHLCHLEHLQLLDLSLNDISGRIPTCFHNFTAMKLSGSNITLNMIDLSSFYFASVRPYTGTVLLVGTDYILTDIKVQIEWKGKLREFKSTLSLVKSIDLSSNQLIGEIPREISQLPGLVSLNLSRNNLSGQIPPEIGLLKSLDVLDLSRNHLVGKIPLNLTQIDRLNALDLSNNNLSGKIPTGTQLQSFPNAYMGNDELCGDPLPKKCPDEEHESTGSQAIDEEANEPLERGFYISMALGFIVGFWGVCGALIFHKTFRYSYFKLLNDAGDWLCVMAAIHKAKLLRMIKS